MISRCLFLDDSSVRLTVASDFQLLVRLSHVGRPPRY